MKIVQVISNLGKGGAERLVVDLCNELSETGEHEVFLCVFYERGGMPTFKDELSSRVKYINLGKTGKIDLKFQWRLLKFLRDTKPGVVNSHLSGTILYLYLPILFLRKIKFFHTIHNLAEEETPNRFFQRLRKRIYRTNRLVPVSISSITKESHSRLYKTDSELIYNGTKEQSRSPLYKAVQEEARTYKNNEDTKVFLSVGRINSPKDQKNYRLLVDVFLRLHQSQVNAILLVIGNDSSDGQQVLRDLKERNPHNVVFLGVKSNVVDYMLHADFYCLSSRFEGLPITVIEALSHGLPVVSTRVGGIPEMIVTQENGILVDSLDEKDYYNAVIEILSWDSSKLKAVKETNIKTYKEHFGIAAAAQHYLTMYQNNKHSLALCAE